MATANVSDKTLLGMKSLSHRTGTPMKVLWDQVVPFIVENFNVINDLMCSDTEEKELHRLFLAEYAKRYSAYMSRAICIRQDDPGLSIEEALTKALKSQGFKQYVLNDEGQLRPEIVDW